MFPHVVGGFRGCVGNCHAGGNHQIHVVLHGAGDLHHGVGRVAVQGGGYLPGAGVLRQGELVEPTPFRVVSPSVQTTAAPAQVVTLILADWTPRASFSFFSVTLRFCPSAPEKTEPCPSGPWRCFPSALGWAAGSPRPAWPWSRWGFPLRPGRLSKCPWR